MSRFNLLEQAWIPVKGRSEHLKVCEIVRRDVLSLDAPRADFNAALMQFLIGLLQTVMAPETPKGWRNLYTNPPSENELQAKLDTIKEAFYLDGDGYRFMQDASIQQQDKIKPIEEIIFGAPGDNTKKKNIDLFVKKQDIKGLCVSCSASAILAANIFADNGGPGYFESMRGNGFISNLVCVDEKAEEASLWRDIWLNVLQTNFFNKNQNEKQFLWMEPIPDDDIKRRETSEKIKNITLEIEEFNLKIKQTEVKDEQTKLREEKKELDKAKRAFQQTRKDITGIYPEMAHPLQVYWAWMRRIYIQFEEPSNELCSVCNKYPKVADTIFKTNKAFNYPKAYWQHPLSAYKQAEGGEYEGKFLALDMTTKGLPYIYWNDFIKATEKQFPASVVEQHLKKKLADTTQLILWSGGYAMDSNSPLGWYESKTPFYLVADENHRQMVEREIDRYIQASNKISDNRNGYLINAIKNAWFDENKEKNKDQKKTFNDTRAIEIGKSFWNNTHDKFYQLINLLYSTEGQLNDNARIQLSFDWYQTLKQESEKIFADWAFKSNIQTNPKRIALAHKQLMQNLKSQSLKNETLGLPKEHKYD